MEAQHSYVQFGGGSGRHQIHSPDVSVERPEYLKFRADKARFMEIKTESQPRKIHYEIHGNGPRKLVLIMGLGGTHVQFENMILYFGIEKSNEYSVLVFDNRGAGFSSFGSVLGRWTSSSLAKDAINLVEHIGKSTLPDEGKEWLQGVELAGCSMGGMIALEFALNAPHLVSSLTLISTHAGGLIGSLVPLGGIKLFLRTFISVLDQVSMIDNALEILFPRDWLDAKNIDLEDSTVAELEDEQHLPNDIPAQAKNESYTVRRYHNAMLLLRRNRKFVESNYEGIYLDVTPLTILYQLLAVQTHYM